MLEVTPFRYEEPLDPDELVDREAELAALLERAAAGRNTRLSAPRRYGKTSLLRRLLRDGDRDGIIGVYVDCYGVLTVADVAARVETAYGEALRGPLARWFAGLRRSLQPVGRLSAGPASVQVGGAAPRPGSDQAALLERLAMPKALSEKTGTVVLVVFDEFQALLAAGSQLDAVLRSEIQHHGDRVAYVFAGSHPGMMRELFATRSRPFFDQAAPLELGPLADGDLAEHIGATFEQADRGVEQVLPALLAQAEGHPQRAMQLAAHVWAQTARGSDADHATWEATLESVRAEVGEAFREHWDGLPVSYRRVLSAIADGDAPLLSKASQTAHGTRPGASGRAVDALHDSGDIVRDERVLTGWRIVDPLWRSWIASGRGWR